MEAVCENEEYINLILIYVALPLVVLVALMLAVVSVMINSDYNYSQAKIIAMQETIDEMDLEIGLLKKKYNPVTLSVSN